MMNDIYFACDSQFCDRVHKEMISCNFLGSDPTLATLLRFLKHKKVTPFWTSNIPLSNKIGNIHLIFALFCLEINKFHL